MLILFEIPRESLPTIFELLRVPFSIIFVVAANACCVKVDDGR